MKFKNVSFEVAIDFLSGREVGDFIIRPSSKGKNNLTITWKFYDFIYVHLDLEEAFKGPNDLIGRKLKLKDATYDNLDELIAGYIQPCNMIDNQIRAHKKFEKGAPDTIELKLKQEKEKDSKTIPYLFGFSTDAPQYIILFYISKGMEITKEYIKIKPKGLLFHDLTFPNLGNLIIWFKAHFKKPEYQKYVKHLKPPIQAPKTSQNVKQEKIEPHYAGTGNYFNNSNAGGNEPNDIRIKQETKVKDEGRFGPKRENERVCNTCRQPGHLANNCPLADERQKESRNFRGDRQDSSSRFNRDKSNPKNFSGSIGNRDYNANKSIKREVDEEWGSTNDNKNIQVKQEYNATNIKKEEDSAAWGGANDNAWAQNDKGWAADPVPSRPSGINNRGFQGNNRTFDRNDRDRGERGERGDRGDRGDRGERGDRGDRGDRREGDRGDREDRGYRRDREDKGSRNPRGDNKGDRDRNRGSGYPRSKI